MSVFNKQWPNDERFLCVLYFVYSACGSAEKCMSISDLLFWISRKMVGTCSRAKVDGPHLKLLLYLPRQRTIGHQHTHWPDEGCLNWGHHFIVGMSDRLLVGSHGYSTGQLPRSTRGPEVQRFRGSPVQRSGCPEAQQTIDRLNICIAKKIGISFSL